MENGYTNKLVRFNLSNNKITVESLPKIAQSFMGGKGLGAYILTRELKPKIDPLGENNKLIIATGPLQGTDIPICGRYCIVTKSPLTGLFLDSHAGGFIGPELKFAGYDAVIIEGKSAQPSFLFISDKELDIKNGTFLKGLTVQDKEIAIKRTIKEPNARIMSIGIAGEKKIKMACVTSDSFRNIGRGGVGAVFGAKNLLAIAIKGPNRIISGNSPEKIRKLAISLHKRANNARKSSHWMYKWGTTALLPFASKVDQLPVKNFQFGTIETPNLLGQDQLSKYKIKKKPCYKCSISCAHIFNQEFSFTDKKEHFIAVPEYETLAMIGANCNVDFETVIEANYLANEFSLDTISTGNVCAFFMECSEKGLLPKDYENEKVLFGDKKGLLGLIKKITYREGIGNLLAEGSKQVAEVIGQNSDKFAIHVKGLEMAAWDPRGKLALGLSYATADVGASHLRGWPNTIKLPKDEYISEKIVQSLIDGQDLKIIKDSLIICHFTHSIKPALSLEDTQNLYEATTGHSSNVQEIAQNIWALTRYFNMREFNNPLGMYDTLPYRLLNEPLPSGSAAGSMAFQSEEDFQTGLKILYGFRKCNRNGNLLEDEVKRIESLIK